MSFKYYDRNGELIMEGKNEQLNTIGFTKDGHTVLDSKVINNSKSTPELTLKTDTSTGKKFIFRDGKWMEILSANCFQKNIVIKKIIKPAKIDINKNHNKLVLQPIMKSVDSNLLSVGEKTSRDIDCQTDNSFKEKCFIDNSTQTEHNLITPITTSPLNFLQDDLNFLDDESLYLKLPSSDLLLDSCDNMLNSDSELNLLSNNSNRILFRDGFNLNNYSPNKRRFFMDLRSALQFNSSGNLPIHESVVQNNITAVTRNCIILKARRLTPNIRNHYNHSALQLAILIGADKEIIRTLLKFGADVTLLDSDGDSVFHLAAQYKRIDHMKLLLDHAICLDIEIDLFNYEGYTPLILCCNSSSYENAKFLLEHGANVNLRDRKSGRTPLFHAVENFDLAMIELLLEYNADKKIRNFVGTSAHDAVFEIDDIPIAIKYLILGKTQLKRKIERDDLKRKKTNTEDIKFIEIVNENSQ